MSQITRVPFGLQDLLGSKNFGNNPSELGQVVAPVLEMGAFLRAERRTFEFAPVVQQFSNGDGGTIQVPLGELWMVDAIGARITTAGAGGFTSRWAIFGQDLQNSSTAGAFHALADLGEVNQAVATAGGFVALSHDFPNPLPMFGDEIIRISLSGGNFSSTQNYSSVLVVRYTRLTI